MVLPDINLLIYAYNLHSPHHAKAKAWWQQCLSGNNGIALAWVVIQSFVRISTHPRIFENPMTVEEAIIRVEE